MTSRSKKKVLITGASGLIGGLVLRGLGDRYDLSAVNRRAIEGIPCVQA
ncbi:MAG: SDR family oxidoreductase, partial [Deltaproteobacteria bacterium]|nr:SDR family oxidoreductase [Deltaproteobacteria bacterium]